MGLAFRPGLLAPRPTSGPEWGVLQTDSCSSHSPRDSGQAGQGNGRTQTRLEHGPRPPLALFLQGYLHRRHLLHYRRAAGHGQRVHLIQPQHWCPGDYQGAATSQSSTKPRPNSMCRRPRPTCPYFGLAPPCLWQASLASCSDPYVPCSYNRPRPPTAPLPSHN